MVFFCFFVKPIYLSGIKSLVTDKKGIEIALLNHKFLRLGILLFNSKYQSVKK